MYLDQDAHQIDNKSLVKKRIKTITSLLKKLNQVIMNY